MTESEERSIGRLEARVDHIARTLDEVRAELRNVTGLVEQGKGARRLAMMLGAIGGGMMSALAGVAGLFRAQ